MCAWSEIRETGIVSLPAAALTLVPFQRAGMRPPDLFFLDSDGADDGAENGSWMTSGAYRRRRCPWNQRVAVKNLVDTEAAAGSNPVVPAMFLRDLRHFHRRVPDSQSRPHYRAAPERVRNVLRNVP